MKNYFNYKFILSLYLFLSVRVFPENYNLDNGISQSLINCITQDKTGFLWVGTQEGLNCFDGYSFKVYKNDPGNCTSTLTNNNIRDLFIDMENNIWIGTHGGGLNKFDRKTNCFKQYSFTSGGLSGSSDYVITRIIPSGDDVLYLGTEKYGLVKFEINSGRMERLSKLKISSPENNITSVLTFAEDTLLLGTDAGLFIYDKRRNAVIKFLPQKFAGKRITSVYKTKSGGIIAGTFSGAVYSITMKRDDRYEKKYVIRELMNKGIPIIFISSDNHGSILIGTDFGISACGEEDLAPQRYTYYTPSGIDGLNLRATAVFIGRSNIMWIGTINKGLFKIAGNHKKFNLLDFSAGKEATNNSVWSILKEDNGIIWIGTDGNGLIKLDSKTGAKRIWRNNQYDKKSLSNNSVSSMAKDRKGNLWLTTFGGGVNYMAAEGKFQHFYNIPGNDQSISSDHVWKVFEDKVGNVWFGSRGGLDCLTFQGRKFIHYKHDAANPYSLSNNNVLTIFEDSEGVLWIGTYGGGLNKMDRRTGKFTHYIHSDKDNRSLSDNSVMCICEDANKNLWLGCDIGMNKMNKTTGKFTRYYENNGLPNNVVYSVIADSNRNIWGCTNKGIFCYNPANNIFKSYDYRDGLQSNEFSEGAYFYSSDGEIYFGGIEGINYFRPSEIIENPNLPNVVIEKVKVMNTELPSVKFTHENSEIKLSYNDNYIQIEFAGLEFTDPVKNQYKYMLEGFDKEWNYSGQRRIAIYTNLDPGNYTFKVCASNNDGIWNTKETSLMLSIAPPYWMTWWFRIAVAILVISIFYSIHRIKVKRILEIERLRLQIASDLHDEVGSSLTSLAIQTQLLNFEKDNIKMKERTGLIEELSRKVINTMSDVVWSIDSRNDNLQNLINRIKDFSFQLLNDKNIQINYSINLEAPEKKVSIDIKQNIYLIFKEAINNTVKHSGAQKLDIKIVSTDECFEMIIRDDGKGLDESVNGMGNGLRNMEMRAKRIGGKLDIISENGLTIKLRTNRI